MATSKAITLFFLFITLATTGYTQDTDGVVSGQVVDEDENPVADATVALNKLGMATVTSSDGTFSLQAPAGDYTLSISMMGYTPYRVEVNVEAGSHKRLSRIEMVRETDRVLSEVDVIGKTVARQIEERPFNVNVIDVKQLYNTTSDLNQVLNQTSGVRIREDGGVGSNFSFSLNGFSGRQVKFFLDGIPMDNFGSSLTLNNFPTTMVERMEVYKGVLPVSLGADALGGAVNIVTRSNPNFVDLSYGYGSFNTHKAGVNAAYTNAETGFSARINAFYNYSDNNYQVAVNPIDLNTGQKGPMQKVERFHDGYQSAGAQVELGVTDRPYADKLFVGMIVSGNEKDIQTGVTMEQVFGARTAQSQSLIPTLKYKKSNLFAEGLDLNLYAAYNMTANQFIDTARMRYNWLQETIPTSTAEVSRTQLENQDNEALVTANLAYRVNGANALSYNYVLTDFKRSSSDVENPDNITFTLPQRLSKQTMGLAWQSTYGAWTATAFGKLYLLHAESFENVSTNNVADYQPTATDRSHFGYGVATAYFITPELQAKASFEHTYRLPEAIELLGDGLYVRRNSALRPERSNNVNVGALYAFQLGTAHRLNVEGNFIYRNASDYIRQDQQQVQPVDRQFINVGNVNTTGVEGEIRYNWNNTLFVTANATFQDIIDKTEFLTSTNLTGTIVTRNLNYGYRIPNMPYLFGNASVGVRLLPFRSNDQVLNVNYSVNYVKDYYLTPNHIGAGNSDIIPQQLAHNLMLDYSLAQGKYTVALECRNLTDEMLYDNYLLQKPGRSFFVKLRYFLNH